MNYPIWELTTIGGPSIIALIAVTHVFVSHFAVGGGLYIWLMDWHCQRTRDLALTDFIRRHTWFFLLLTMVFGGLSGVGIWFIIALVQPAATSILIHNFVFGWAIEWVFFVGEIVALLVYHYFFQQLDSKRRLHIAFLYFLFAWLSLVVINGILCFMLTPGDWLDNGKFWAGFFNPTYFPSLFFRSFAAIMLAGLFSYITSWRQEPAVLRNRLMRIGSGWLITGLLGMVPSGYWYLQSIPESIRFITFELNPQTAPFFTWLLWSSLMLLFLGLALALLRQTFYQRVGIVLVILVGFMWMGSFEYVREIARKPFVITDHIYSNGILMEDLERFNETGFLPEAKWSAVRSVTSENRLEAGYELFNLQCLACHTVGGIRNDILPRTEHLTLRGLVAHLSGQGRINAYMPPFLGSAAERDALAGYIFQVLLGKTVQDVEPYQYFTQPLAIPQQNLEETEYVLLAWNDLGMHCMSDNDRWWGLLPPANTLEAQLILRGDSPEVITDATVSYEVEPGFENPAGQVNFWEWSEPVWGTALEPDMGLFGNGLNGEMAFSDQSGTFIAHGIPVIPYQELADGAVYNPYPLFKITARSVSSGEKLAETVVVAPVSTELGCKNCHVGGWRWNDESGLSDELASKILKIHDRDQDTALLADAQAGRPQACSACHPDAAVKAEGQPGVLSLSVAMHGFHANVLPDLGSEACAMCHPASTKGNTACLRGFHRQLGLGCVDCHGYLEDHALALLLGERANPATERLIARLAPRLTKSLADIVPRKPWINQPDCLTCHEYFEQPEHPASGYNDWVEFDDLYRQRWDEAEVLRCSACHGPPHALYPAENPISVNRDNYQPLQYGAQIYPIGANERCITCHTEEMDESIHHSNMYRMVRNEVETK